MNNLTIALDAMSGDFGASVVVHAAKIAHDIFKDVNFIIVGDKYLIKSFLKKKFQRISVIESSSVITNQMKTSHAMRNSVGSSMRIALELVQNDVASACVSAGNTGALMGLSKLLLSSIAGIDRPALVTTLPTLNDKKTVMLDLGANVECNSDMLVQFAMMGSVLAESILNIKSPRISLLNIGKEDPKGIDKIRFAAEILKKNSYYNFIGYIESNELLTGKTDVLVCDGFSGNIALKTLEGLINLFLNSDNFLIRKSLVSRIKNLLLKNQMNKLIDHLNPSHFNGACLLGLKKIVIKSHGNACQNGFLSAIEQAIFAAKNDIPNKIASRLASNLSKSAI